MNNMHLVFVFFIFPLDFLKLNKINFLYSANFSMSNNSLNYLRSTLGYSYMCSAEQTLFVTPSFSLNTFDLQVQPFGVKSGRFATGMNELSMLFVWHYTSFLSFYLFWLWKLCWTRFSTLAEDVWRADAHLIVGSNILRLDIWSLCF